MVVSRSGRSRSENYEDSFNEIQPEESPRLDITKKINNNQ